MGSFWWIHYL